MCCFDRSITDRNADTNMSTALFQSFFIVYLMVVDLVGCMIEGFLIDAQYSRLGVVSKPDSRQFVFIRVKQDIGRFQIDE